MNETATEQSQEQARNRRKILRGVVVSDKMDQTCVVLVERTTLHPHYRKVIRVRKKFYVHNADNQAKLGDTVEFMGTRPLSKLKRWRLTQIVRSAPVS